MVLNTYSSILTNSDLEEAIEFALHYDFTQDELLEQNISKVYYEDRVGDIDIYYCYGTDSYLFTPHQKQ